MNRHEPISPDDLDTIKMLVHDGYTRLGIVLDYALNVHVLRHRLCPEPTGGLRDEIWSLIQKTTRTMKPVCRNLEAGKLLHGDLEGMGFRLLHDDSVINRFGRVKRPSTPKYGGVRYFFKIAGKKSQSWSLARIKAVAW